jgi:predicted DNA-binding transcriptional regulator YafY
LKISDGKLFKADKLATEFELSERTIYRDMSALIQMGIPIRSEAGVGYQLKILFEIRLLSKSYRGISRVHILEE